MAHLESTNCVLVYERCNSGGNLLYSNDFCRIQKIYFKLIFPPRGRVFFMSVLAQIFDFQMYGTMTDETRKFAVNCTISDLPADLSPDLELVLENQLMMCNSIFQKSVNRSNFTVCCLCFIVSDQIFWDKAAHRGIRFELTHLVYIGNLIFISFSEYNVRHKSGCYSNNSFNQSQRIYWSNSQYR